MAALYRIAWRNHGEDEFQHHINSSGYPSVFDALPKAEAEFRFLVTVEQALRDNFPRYRGKEFRIELAEPQWKAAA